MREIKFRAWDTRHKKMVQVRQMLIPDSNNEYGIQELSVSGLKFDTNPSHWLITQPLMQYTGLKDKNGVEIYEGDIVKLRNYSTYPHEAYFDKRSYGFRLRFNGEMQFDKTLLIDFAKFGEVIGNIHENPKLLEGLNIEA